MRDIVHTALSAIEAAPETAFVTRDNGKISENVIKWIR